MKLHHLSVTRTARVAVLGGPSVDESDAPHESWTVLHGYRQTAPRFARRFRTVASARRRVIAPEGLSRFYLEVKVRAHQTGDAVGASWMTREERDAEIRDYVRYLDQAAREFGGSGRHTVLGFSQGAHTAARWAVLGSTPVHRLVLWGAAFPADLPTEAPGLLASVEIILVRGATDPLRNRQDEEREERWLEAAGLPYRTLEHPGAHEIAPAVLSTLTASPEPTT